jgi:hypothetical protein
MPNAGNRYFISIQYQGKHPGGINRQPDPAYFVGLLQNQASAMRRNINMASTRFLTFDFRMILVM